MTRAGMDDVQQTIRRLWRGDTDPEPEVGKPGPKASLTLDRILEAATAIADARPEAAVSLRPVAARLGCTPMSLYTYVASKRELLDLMYDRIHAELRPPRGATWQARVGGWSDQLLELHVRHPWTREVSLARAVLGPHEQAAFEGLLDVLSPAGLERADTITLAATLFSLARATATTIREARTLEPVEGDPVRWRARWAAREAVAPDFAQRFPRSAALFAQPSPASAPRPSRPAAAGRRSNADQPLMERAARRQHARAVELLLAGAAGSSSRASGSTGG